jgi:hypothetical protein
MRRWLAGIPGWNISIEHRWWNSKLSRKQWTPSEQKEFNEQVACIFDLLFEPNLLMKLGFLNLKALWIQMLWLFYTTTIVILLKTIIFLNVKLKP